MNCINYSSPEYKSLLRDSGLNKMELDGAILEYQDQNNTDEFPSLESIKVDRPEPTFVDRFFDSLQGLKNDKLIQDTSDVVTGIYLNTFDEVTDERLDQIENNMPEHDVNFVKDHLNVEISLTPKTDKLTRDKRLISGTMFQNIVHRMSDIIPGITANGLSNDDYIEFARLNGINESYNSPAFILGDTVFYNSEATMLTKDMAIEESLHPIVLGIQKENPELFKTLFKEAVASYPKLWSEIKDTYKSNQSNELVTQALAREFSDIDKIKLPKRLILRALEAIKSIFNRLFSYDSKSVSDSLKTSLKGIIRDLNTKSGQLIPSFDFNSAYLHKMTRREDNSPYPHQINNKTYQEFVNKKANDIRTALQIRYHSVNRGIKSNAKAVRDVNKILRNISDDALDTELQRNRVKVLEMSQKQLDLLKGEMIIAKFLDGMETNLSELSNRFSAVYNMVANDMQTSLTLEELDDLKINVIDWYREAESDLLSAFQSPSDFFVRYSKYVDATGIQKYEDGEDARKHYYNKYNELSNMLKSIESKYNSLRVSLLQKELRKELIDSGATVNTINTIISEITDPTNDVSWAYEIFGSVNYAKDSLIRLLGFYVNEAKEKVSIKNQANIKKIAKLQDKLKHIYNLDKTFAEYITDDDGKLVRTGNWITDLNRGLAYRNYKKDINNLLKEYELESREEVFNLPDKDRVDFLKKENRIKDKHYERPFIIDYYDALAEIIPEAIDAKADIDDLIKGMSEAVTIDGMPRTENFTPAQARNYESLLKQKRNLANLYDDNGEPKTGVDKKIAESLANFNKKVQELNTKRGKKIIQEWNDTYTRLKNEYQQALNSNDPVTIKKTGDALFSWKQTNVRTEYNQKFWDELSKMSKRSYGDEYAELESKRSDLLKLYRNTFNLEIEVGDNTVQKSKASNITSNTAMSEELKDLIKFIDTRMSEIRQDAPKVRKSYGEVSFNDIAKIVPSQEYNAIKKQLEGTDAYVKWYEENHYNVTINGVERDMPYSFWTVLEPLDEKLIEESPSNLWNDVSDDSGLTNPNFIPDESEEGMVPRRSLYDNTANFNKIKQDPALYELYTELRNMMKESQDLLGDMGKNSTVTLPQKTGKFRRRFYAEYNTGRNFGRFFSFWRGLRAIYKDWFIINEDDPDYNVKTNEDGIQNLAKFRTERSNKYIPTYYTRRLENPEMITKGLVTSVLEYASMAQNYHEMYKILPKINLINEQIGERHITAQGGTESGYKSRLYKKSNAFVNQQVFNKRTKLTVGLKNRGATRWLLGKPEDGQKYRLDLAKPISNSRAWIVAVNLAYKIVPIVADFLTAQLDIELEGSVGRYYGWKDLLKGKWEMIKTIPPLFLNAGSELKTRRFKLFTKNPNKLLNLMMFNEMSFSRIEQMEDMHLTGSKTRVYRAIKQNALFFGWNVSDYIVKSQVTAAVYMNHKLVDGKIMDKQTFIRNYYPNNEKNGKQAWKLQGETLYDAIEIDQNTGDFYFSNPDFKEAYNLSTELYIKGLLHKTMSEIDGQLRDTDKSALHHHALGSYLLMHRGFILANMFKQFRPRAYDFYSRREEFGNYRSAYGALTQILSSKSVINNYSEMNRVSTNKAIVAGFKYTARAISLYLAIAYVSNMFKSGSDDDKDDTLKQYINFQLSRVQFETASKFNPFELSSVLENPTAAMSYVNNMSNLGNWFSSDEVKSGVYKGMPYYQRQLIKSTPFKNIYETIHSTGADYRKQDNLLYKSNILTSLYKSNAVQSLFDIKEDTKVNKAKKQDKEKDKGRI